MATRKYGCRFFYLRVIQKSNIRIRRFGYFKTFNLSCFIILVIIGKIKNEKNKMGIH